MFLKPTFLRSIATSRILELDALRGMAALSVVAYHYTTRYDQIYGHRTDMFYSLSVGRYGVLLFFIISGFVVSLSLERTQRSLDFVVSRFGRLFPTYWLAIAITFITVAATGLPGRQVSLKAALLNGCMVHRFWRIPDVDGVYWTLFVEFIFYVVMLGLYKAKLLPFIERVLVIWLGINTLEIYRIFINIPEQIEPWFLLGYAHLFMMGIVFYRIRTHGNSILRYCILAGCFTYQIALYPEWDKHVVVVIFMGLFGLVNAGKLWAIAVPPLLALGTLSYPLYLLHQNIGYIIIRELEGRGVSPNLSIFLAFCAAIALAAGVSHYVEKPSFRWIQAAYRRKFPLATSHHMSSQ